MPEAPEAESSEGKAAMSVTVTVTFNMAALQVLTSLLLVVIALIG